MSPGPARSAVEGRRRGPGSRRPLHRPARAGSSSSDQLCSSLQGARRSCRCHGRRHGVLQKSTSLSRDSFPGDPLPDPPHLSLARVVSCAHQ